jgi:ATP-dependent helicase/nuclease subunit B
MYKAVNQIKNYVDTYEAVATPEQLYIMYKQIADLAEVSFEGEPLQGLQIMGVLESRVLDFDTVIITSLNEGKFPSGKSNNSFIPYDVKQELGLPTYKEKDAIYSYHFYHMIKRAGNVYLIYNSETEGMNSAEKSRFITQLEIEKQPNHNLINSDYYSFIPDKAYVPVTIPKSSELLSELKKIATEKGFSPSALSNYLRNPIQFYFQRILRIRELDEVEENVALNTLGTIIHNSLEELFRPYLNQYLTLENMQQIEQKVEAEINSQFELIYSNAKDKLGKNLLAYEVAKRNIIHYLNFEKEAIINGDAIKILALEKELSYEITDERLPYPVKISGIVDRIEIRNNTLRIIDYKTGRVEKNQVRIKTFDGLTTDLKYEKVIQLLGYALMYQNEEQLYPLEVGIYSFKNRKGGFLLFNLEQDKHIQTVISPDIIDAFKNELIGLILEILDPKIAFEENMG